MAISQHSDVSVNTREHLYNIQAIFQSLMTILHTQKGERLMNPEFGTDLEKFLWRRVDEDTKADIHLEIVKAISFDPRIKFNSLHIDVDKSNNCYNCRLSVLYDENAYSNTFELKSKVV